MSDNDDSLKQEGGASGGLPNPLQRMAGLESFPSTCNSDTVSDSLLDVALPVALSALLPTSLSAGPLLS